MTNTFVSGARTHQGGRDHNEDAMLLGDGLFAVADGLGGLDDGEVASRLALDELQAAFNTERSVSGLLRACQQANEAVWRQAKADASMATTLVAVATGTDTGAVVAHVGDSRLYRLRHGRLEQLTRDHTVTEELLRNGAISEAAAEDHPHRSMLTRAVGAGPDVEVDHAGLTCQPGDRLLLSTDGLFRTLSTDTMTSVLEACLDPQDAADELVNRAVDDGSDDNVTALVINVGQPSDAGA